jgi:hypothetical protein
MHVKLNSVLLWRLDFRSDVTIKVQAVWSKKDPAPEIEYQERD